jgi:hypothetical protein
VQCETSSRVLYRTSILLDSDIVLHHAISQHDEAQTRTHIPLQPLLTTRLPILLTPVAQSNIMSKKTNSTATKKRKSKELSNTKCRTTAKKKKKKRKALFVVKLFQFLMSDDQHVDIVSWYKDCFVVWDRNLFEANVLPVLFSHNQYASFDRQTNFYNFAKMSFRDEFPTHKRIGKKDPIKYKHRMFYKGASLQQIQSIERSTSPHQLQELQETLECVNAQNSGIVEAMKSIQERICNAQQVLHQLLHRPTLIPATNKTVVEATLNNDGQANLAIWAAPEATHALPATETMSVATHVQTFEFEMLEPNKEDVAMFSGVAVNGMESNMIELAVLNPTFDYI